MAGMRKDHMAPFPDEQIHDADYTPCGEVTDTPWVRPSRSRQEVAAAAPLCVVLAGLLLAVSWMALDNGDREISDPGAVQIVEAGPPMAPAPGPGGSRLGLSTRTVSAPVAAYFSAGDQMLVPGAQVYALEKEGPAARAGLRSGDIITAVEDMTVASEEDLAQAEEQADPGQSVTFTVYRDGEYMDIETTIPNE